MAEKTPAQKKKQIIIATVAFLFGLYRMGTPYMEETDDMKKEADKIAKQVTDIRDEAAQYGKGWQDRMDKIEKDVKAQLPDSLDSGAVLEYFLARFEKEHPGAVTFLSVSTQAISYMPMKSGREGDKEPPRTQRYKLEARMAQDQVVPYIQHMESYSGLFMITDFTFHLEKEFVGALKMEMALIFFLSPKEWITTDPKVAAKDDDDDDDEDLKPKGWTQVFLPALAEPGRPAAASSSSREPAHARRAFVHKVPTPDRLVGGSVVIDESLYEEGDKVGPWTITRVDQAAHKVTFKAGSTIKTVSVK